MTGPEGAMVARGALTAVPESTQPTAQAARTTMRDMAVLALFVLLVYGLPAYALNGVSADSIEYLVAGKNFWEGRGYTLDMKGYPMPELQRGGSAAPLRPIGYAAVAGLLYTATRDVHVVQVLNVILAAVNVVLVYRLTLRASRRVVALSAAVLVALSPTMAQLAYQVMSEQLSLLLVLTAMLCVVARPGGRERWGRAGVWAGLAFMVRTVNVSVLAGLLLASLWRKDVPLGARARQAGLLGLGWVLVTVPIVLGVFGTVRFPSAIYLRAVELHDLYRLAEPSPLAPSAVQLLQTRWPDVVARILSNCGQYLTLLLSSQWLSLAAAGLPLALASVLVGEDRWFRVLGLTALAQLLVLDAYWVVLLERYLLLPFVLLLPLCLVALDRWWFHAGAGSGGRAGLVALGIAVLLLAHPRVTMATRLNVSAVRALAAGTRTDTGCAPSWRRVAAWLDGRHAIVAARDPWEVHWCTGVPAVVLPQADEPALLARYVAAQQVTHVLMNDPAPASGRPCLFVDGEGLPSIGQSAVFEDGRLRICALGPDHARTSEATWRGSTRRGGSDARPPRGPQTEKEPSRHGDSAPDHR